MDNADDTNILDILEDDASFDPMEAEAFGNVLGPPGGPVGGNRRALQQQQQHRAESLVRPPNLPVAVPVAMPAEMNLPDDDVDEDDDGDDDDDGRFGMLEEMEDMAIAHAHFDRLDAVRMERNLGLPQAIPVNAEAAAAVHRDMAVQLRMFRDREDELRRRRSRGEVDRRMLRHRQMRDLDLLRRQRRHAMLMRQMVLAGEAESGPIRAEMDDRPLPGPDLNGLGNVAPNPNDIPANLHPPVAARNLIAAAEPGPPHDRLPRRGFRGLFGLFRRNNNDDAQAALMPPIALNANDADMDFDDMDDADDMLEDMEDIEDMGMEIRMERMVAAIELVRRGGPADADAVQEPSNNRYLFDLIREDLSCIMHTGNPHRNCSTVANFCAETPAAIHYIEDRTRRTPLHEAAMRCACIHTMRALVETSSPVLPERDVRLASQDSEMNTPLSLYIIGMAKRSVLALDDIIAVVTLLIGTYTSNNPANMRNAVGNTALHLACSAPESMMPAGVIALLISVMANGSTLTNNDRKTPLHVHCARRGASLEVARMLVENVPEHRFLHDLAGLTPIHYAASQGNGPLVAYLAECKEVYAVERTTTNSSNVLHFFKEIDTKTLAVILRKAPVCVSARTTDTLMTPLHAMLADVRREISPDVVRMMVTQDAGILRLEDKLGYLPIHYACQTGRDPKIIELLLTRETVVAITQKKDTALSLAASHNSCIETIALLVAAHKPSLTMANNYGFLPLHCVCRAPQPKEAIIRLLLTAFPEARHAKTNAGELPLHLAHNGASKATLHMLGLDANCISDLGMLVAKSKVGNTPLHNACVRLVGGTASIETMAEDHPEWLFAVNNAGYTPVQLLCRNGFIDARLVRCFYNLVGIAPFKSVDSAGHTPLHSAVRCGSREAVRALIEVHPDALKIKTIYGDTPLHLACYRNVAFIGDIAKLSCETATQHGSHISPLLIRNRSGETPISIVMSELKTQHGQCFSLGKEIDYSQLAALIKILYYGTDGFEEGGLVVACLALHRQGARIDPSFIRRVLIDHPEQLRIPDSEGNYPLHLEASIPIEKMTLLDGENTSCSCHVASCRSRATILKTLLDIYPEAAKYTNKNGESVLSLIIKNGRQWNPTFAFIVRANPAALHVIENHELMPQVIARIGNGCGADTLYAFLRARPSILIKKPE